MQGLWAVPFDHLDCHWFWCIVCSIDWQCYVHSWYTIWWAVNWHWSNLCVVTMVLTKVSLKVVLLHQWSGVTSCSFPFLFYCKYVILCMSIKKQEWFHDSGCAKLHIACYSELCDFGIVMWFSHAEHSEKTTPNSFAAINQMGFGRGSCYRSKTHFWGILSNSCGCFVADEDLCGLKILQLPTCHC